MDEKRSQEHGVWCIAPGGWLRDGRGQAKRFDDKVNAIVAKNEMRRMLQTARERNPKYDYYVAPFVEG